MHLIALGLATALAARSVCAQNIDVRDAWVRATVPGQTATGAFMKISAPAGATLVAVASPLAGVAEIHEMKMDAGVMTMRAVRGGLDLPAGQTVEFKSGGRHVMLMDLKAVLRRDSSVALTLVFRDKAGSALNVVLQVPVANVSPFVGTAPQRLPSVHGH